LRKAPDSLRTKPADLDWAYYLGRSRALPNGDVLIGHRSAQASHLGNIAYMEKRRVDFDPVREEILPF
jgi:hypothetical protein